MVVSKTVAVVTLVAGVAQTVMLPQNKDVNSSNTFSQLLNQLLEVKAGNTTDLIYVKFMMQLTDTPASNSNYDAAMPIIPAAFLDCLRVAMRQGAIAVSVFSSAAVTSLVLNVGK